MALLSTIRDLHRRKGRERRGLALAEGVRLVEEMLASGVVCKGAAFGPSLDATPRGQRLRSALEARQLPLEAVSDADLMALATTEHPQGIVAVYQPREWSIAECAPRSGHPLVVLDGVQDPGNVGTIARTAVAFGASGLLALPGTADLTNPKALRAAMGALFVLPHRHAADDDVLQFTSRASTELWALEMKGETLARPADGQALVLLVGNEGAGVRPDLAQRATRRVTIPIGDGTESLNVAVAAAIALYQVTR